MIGKKEYTKLQKDMLNHARNLEFEDAAKCRDRLDILKLNLLEVKNTASLSKRIVGS